VNRSRFCGAQAFTGTDGARSYVQRVVSFVQSLPVLPPTTGGAIRGWSPLKNCRLREDASFHVTGAALPQAFFFLAGQQLRMARNQMTEAGDAMNETNRAMLFLRERAVSIAVFVILLTIVFLNVALGRNYPFLSDNTDFGSFFSLDFALLDALLVGVLMPYCHALGKCVAKPFSLCLPGSVATALGVVVLNMLFIPLAFLNLVYVPVLLALFFAIGLLAHREVQHVWEKIGRLRLGSRRNVLAAMVFMVLLGGHVLNAVAPVGFHESLGDMANTYLYVPMSFAYFHGIRFVPRLAGSLADPANHAVLTSTFIVLSNPGIVKLVGVGVQTRLRPGSKGDILESSAD